MRSWRDFKAFIATMSVELSILKYFAVALDSQLIFSQKCSFRPAQILYIQGSLGIRNRDGDGGSYKDQTHYLCLGLPPSSLHNATFCHTELWRCWLFDRFIAVAYFGSLVFV
ncbi:hypothetical protein ATN88_18285 [Enterovibrio coralii]|uniref:Uncharacterized protein n=1 Tax=Enterovibrio coralii TaxID=294935 RepID=A0A135I8Z0_9GAMM|nr:hypothetical protein ATN88_18285 [Enterovibrio coralii]